MNAVVVVVGPRVERGTYDPNGQAPAGKLSQRSSGHPICCQCVLNWPYGVSTWQDQDGPPSGHMAQNKPMTPYNVS
jgi:hypothetical protein